MKKPIELREIEKGLGIWMPVRPGETTFRIIRGLFMGRKEYTAKWTDFMNCEHRITGSTFAELRGKLKPYGTAFTIKRTA